MTIHGRAYKISFIILCLNGMKGVLIERLQRQESLGKRASPDERHEILDVATIGVKSSKDNIIN